MSPYLTGAVRVGDSLELRGPIDGNFVWRPWEPSAVVAVGGRQLGYCSLMAMLRHRKRAGLRNHTKLLFSIRPPEDVIYGQELAQLAREDDFFALHLTYTLKAPLGW